MMATKRMRDERGHLRIYVRVKCAYCSRYRWRFPFRVGKFCSRKCSGAGKPRATWVSQLLRLLIKGRPGECWGWRRHKQRGYGQISAGGNRMRAHRASYIHFVGNIPKGKMVLHHCDNRSCCNPKHLYVGTAKDNTRDMLQRGRGRWQK